jgi:hypothetical protein
VIRIHHQLHRWPDRFAHDTRRIRIFLHTEADLKFHRGKSFGDVTRRLLGEIADGLGRSPPEQSSRVSNNLRPLRTAKQLLHRNAKMLAFDVPQRDIDAAQALDDDTLLTVIAQARIDHLPQTVGRQRILAEAQWRDAIYHGRGHPRRAVAFAPADVP